MLIVKPHDMMEWSGAPIDDDTVRGTYDIHQ